MIKPAVKYLSIVISIYILSMAIDTIMIYETDALLMMGLVLLLVNLVLKPVLLLITLPFNVLTFGLFGFIVNAWTIMIADHFVYGIRMGGFFNSLLTALVIVVIQHLLKDILQPSK